MFGDYSLPEIQAIKHLFDMMDIDQNGSINLEEFVNSPAFQFRLVYVLHGHCVHEMFSSHLATNADGMFSAIAASGSGEFSFEELLSCYCRFASKKDIANMMVRYECNSQFFKTS